MGIGQELRARRSAGGVTEPKGPSTIIVHTWGLKSSDIVTLLRAEYIYIYTYIISIPTWTFLVTQYWRALFFVCYKDLLAKSCSTSSRSG